MSKRAILAMRRSLVHVGASDDLNINLNGLVHCVFADRASTYPAADRRKTKPSGGEARVWLGDHDPPTPMDKAERSAKELSEQTRGRDQLHPGLWPLSFPPPVSPTRRSPRARRHLGQRVTADCPNQD